MNKEVKEALSSALSALHILAGQDCSEKLPPTLKKSCEERKREFTEAYKIIKEFINKDDFERRENERNYF